MKFLTAPLLCLALLAPTLAQGSATEEFLAARQIQASANAQGNVATENRTEDRSQNKAANPDPLEKFNRFIFKINDGLDTYILVPIAKGYREILPSPARRGLLNFSSNLVQTNTSLYQVLQGKPGRAGISLARFLINVTLGFGGLFDPASDMGLPKYSEDLGQTLGSWGIGPGPYIVVPFLGPSTLRDTLSRIPAYFISVQNNLLDSDDSLNFFVIDTLAFRESLLGAEDLFSGDKYITLRDALMSRRQWQVSDGKVEAADESELDDLLDEFFDEEFLDDVEEEEGSEDSLRLRDPSAPLLDLTQRADSVDFPYPLALYSPGRRRLALLRMARDFDAAMHRQAAPSAQPPQPAATNPKLLADNTPHSLKS